MDKLEEGLQYSQCKQNSQCGHLEEPPQDFLHCSQPSWAYSSLSNSSHTAVVSL